jgi:predicted HTH transcriptional regulator
MTQSREYREIAFALHGKECQRCGSNDEIEVHHRDRNRSNNSPENLEVLCHECHMDEHHEERSERASLHETPAEELVLDILKEGRVTAPYIAKETGYSNAYARDILNDLVKHDHVEKVHKGLYELLDDPRDHD